MDSRARIHLPTPLTEVRESAISAHLKKHADEYTQQKQLRVFVGTWNVNGQPVYTTPVNLWLSCDPFPPDVYAIGFQELDLSKEAYLFQDSPREAEWLKKCEASLHPKAKYVKIKHIRLIGMMLIIFVKEELKKHVTNVAAETVGTGIMRKIGNKGGVSIRLDLHNTSICFVNSHLAAHVEECHRRNQDYQEICSRTVFNQFHPPKYITNHDHVYWLGDLNYRIDHLSADEIKFRVAEKRFDSVFAYDQLNIQMKHKRVFEDFTEPRITYSPTYKYDPGTSEWDSSEKNRPPAWCDRILYRGGPTEPILYRSHEKLILSDHKPVSCLFSAAIKVIDETKFRKVYEKVMKSLDRMENDSLPQAKLDKLEIVFRSVNLKEKSSEIMTIQNTGQVPVIFEFIPKPNDSSYCKSWLQISPFSDLIMPGDSATIEFNVFVTEKDINESTGKLDDILVLNLRNGKDFFISVTVNLIKQASAVVDEDEPLIIL